MFKRIVLFLATNLAVILVLSVVLRLLGVDNVLDEQGVGINYEALLILSLVIGFGGSFISLAMSKWLAKRSTAHRSLINREMQRNRGCSRPLSGRRGRPASNRRKLRFTTRRT